MKKTFYYNFLPTKAEEDAAAARNVPHLVTRTLVEIRDLDHRSIPVVDPNNPWLRIRKTITGGDVFIGKISLSEQEMLDLLRPCTLYKANSILAGERSCVLYDNTEAENRYHIYVERGPQNSYTLRCLDLMRHRNLVPGDEVGMFWDVNKDGFRFKILGRANGDGN
ncbi:hypothetical protein SLE2022_014570 [Rubroshorea leprosula]|uniref:Uncharacterized protein n=1 Tax=Rubroshorea leprosula TaxID=152421 RepID=A0AAV5M0B2_9ROSI|nr:hypothetical protein SLEP1_g49752 [Rubroshorea leprosula]